MMRLSSVMDAICQAEVSMNLVLDYSEVRSVP